MPIGRAGQANSCDVEFLTPSSNAFHTHHFLGKLELMDHYV